MHLNLFHTVILNLPKSKKKQIHEEQQNKNYL
jgi:hypothetical protein